MLGSSWNSETLDELRRQHFQSTSVSFWRLLKLQGERRPFSLRLRCALTLSTRDAFSGYRDSKGYLLHSEETGQERQREKDKRQPTDPPQACV